MAILTRSTHTYATQDIPLECDVYESSDFPPDAPVFVFFHSGGLVRGSRRFVPPWLVQTCYQRKWPLISASYRLVPQVDGRGLLADARAAYDFARRLGGGPERRVVVGGASAGCFLAVLIAQHLQPAPLAVLSITGIPTFRHPFFNSSAIVDGEMPTAANVQAWAAESVSVGWESLDDPGVFRLGSILPSGKKNAEFDRAVEEEPEAPSGAVRQGLYGYYVHHNTFLSMVGNVDKGFDWALDLPEAARLESWPVMIMIHGDADRGVPIDVCLYVSRCLGDRARLFVAKDQPHLFEREAFLEDDGHGMDAVNLAVKHLTQAVNAALAES